MIEDIRNSTSHGIRLICRVLDLPRSSYYHAGSPTPTRRADLKLGERIEEIFKHHRSRYGYRRIHAELADSKITCAPARVRRIMDDNPLFPALRSGPTTAPGAAGESKLLL